MQTESVSWGALPCCCGEQRETDITIEDSELVAVQSNFPSEDFFDVVGEAQFVIFDGSFNGLSVNGTWTQTRAPYMVIDGAFNSNVTQPTQITAVGTAGSRSVRITLSGATLVKTGETSIYYDGTTYLIAFYKVVTDAQGFPTTGQISATVL